MSNTATVTIAPPTAQDELTAGLQRDGDLGAKDLQVSSEYGNRSCSDSVSGPRANIVLLLGTGPASVSAVICEQHKADKSEEA